MALNALLQHFDGAADRAEENVVPFTLLHASGSSLGLWDQVFYPGFRVNKV